MSNVTSDHVLCFISEYNAGFSKSIKIQNTALTKITRFVDILVKNIIIDIIELHGSESNYYVDIYDTQVSDVYEHMSGIKYKHEECSDEFLAYEINNIAEDIALNYKLKINRHVRNKHPFRDLMSNIMHLLIKILCKDTQSITTQLVENEANTNEILIKIDDNLGSYKLLS